MTIKYKSGLGFISDIADKPERRLGGMTDDLDRICWSGIPVFNRELHYGNGLFETLVERNGRVALSGIIK